ncbi:MAG: glutamate-5-semialdehyde dehydrogenase [Magnetococcus sp. DMHC-6]
MIDITAMIKQIGQQAKQAARELAWASGDKKNRALILMAQSLRDQAGILIAANQLDLIRAEQQNLTPAMLDRLRLTEAHIEGMAEGLSQIAQLPDPVGAIDHMRRMVNQMQVGQMRVPLGVIGIIYESRPNVTADAAGLCLKSGNAVILRGGSEAIHSNRAITTCLIQALVETGLPKHAIQFIDTIDRNAVGLLLKTPQYIDVIIPRGGKELIQRIMAESHIPVIKHLDGNCHTYVDSHADLEQAFALTLNGKMQRTGVCNATETLLVHADIAKKFLPKMAKLLHEAGCELRVCELSRKLIGKTIPVQTATAEDWDCEYLGPILAIRVVESIQAALDHIEAHSSRHTEVIVTQDHQRAMRFLRQVDSAAVLVNASSRLNDGFQFGLGAEIGISTDKLHVRGPVGLEGLTCQKYVVFGDGQIRS